MSQSSQPVLSTHGRTRKVDGSAIITKSAPPCISAMAKPPPAVNTGNTLLCDVSLASRGVRSHHRLAAQHAVLIGEREAHGLKLLALDGARDLGRGPPLFVGPKLMAGDEVGSGF